jgi:hypothetical protein
MVKIYRFDSRISLTDALRRLVRKSSEAYSPFWHARAMLQRAIEWGEIRLLVDGKEVSPSFFVCNLFIRANEATGEASIGTHKALEKRLDEYNWMLSRADLNKYIREERYKRADM